MKFNNVNTDQDTECNVTVSVYGSVQELASFSVEPLSAMSGLPTWKESVKAKHENRFNPTHPVTQFIYKNLGVSDEKSYEQQVGKPKISKNSEGKLIKQFPTASPQDYICAQVLSKVWASVGGKMETVSFTYASNAINFTAKWNYNKNKFVIAN